MSRTGHSKADYSPANLAKSMEWFHYVLNGSSIVDGRTFGQCDMTFIYDTVRGLPHTDDPHIRIIARKHPICEQPEQPEQPLRRKKILQRKSIKHPKHLKYLKHL